MFYCKINDFQCNAFLRSLLGTSASMLQTVVNAAGTGFFPDGQLPIPGPAFDPPPSFVIAFDPPPIMVTTVPAVTTVMDPPMMAPSILPVIFAVAVIKALILGKSGKSPIKL